MIEDDVVKDEVIKLTHNYFYGIISGVEFDNAIQNMLGTAYPNPAMSSTNISISNADNDYLIKVADVAGRIIKEMTVPAGATNIQIDLGGLESGMYFYYITDGVNKSSLQKLTVIK
jgi:hypothetical protein